MKHLPALLAAGTAIGQSDRELLRRFAIRRAEDDQVAEAAFAALVSRHGPMVLRVCLATLGDGHDAEDAFQATFLVLASRASSIRSERSIGSWLHGVALRVAWRARSRSSRRTLHERRHAEMTNKPAETANVSPSNDEDLNRILQEEIGRLSEKHRAAVVLCYLEGLTHDMAADRLGCPVGTIRSRLATARTRLKRRLTRRGVAPAISAARLTSTLGEGAEPAASSVRMSISLVDSVVRGAMRVEGGEGALGGVVSTEAVKLMKGVVMNILTTKWTLAASSFVAAGILTAGVGVKAYSALGLDQGSTLASLSRSDPALESGQTQPASPPTRADAASKHTDFAKAAEEARTSFLRRSEEQVTSLIQEFQEKEDATRAAILKAKTPEERIALLNDRANPAAYAGALLQLAELDPATQPAEQALIWIASNLIYGSMAERAKEMLARDHSRSAALGPVFREPQASMPGSTATERLFREILANNPDRKLQCQACYFLARHLEGQASFVRLGRLVSTEERDRMGADIQRESWGRDYEERLSKLDVEVLEQEAAALYERLIADCGDVPLPEPPGRPAGVPLPPGRPTNFGDAGRLGLHQLKDLGIGRLAPEIEGVDLDGKPMKLSDYRGKVTAVYFCGPMQLRTSFDAKPAPATEIVRKAAIRYKQAPFVLLGVATTGPGLSLSPDAPDRREDRESFRRLLQESDTPARFWWDPLPDGSPGPIQTAWKRQVDLYLVDGRGVIRYKHVLAPSLLENAIGVLLKERSDQTGRDGSKD